MTKRNLDDLRRDRKAAAAKMETAAAAIDTLEAAAEIDADAVAAAVADFEAAKVDFAAIGVKIARAESVETAQLEAAAGGDDAGRGRRMPAVAANPAERGVGAGLMLHALANAGGDQARAVAALERDGHSGVAASLSGATSGAGGVTIPQAQGAEIIELLRPRVVVRKAGARSVPMPAGELRNARQSGGATAGYGAELDATAVSAQTFDSVPMGFKKLTSLVPISNSLLRHSSVAMAMLVRNDLLEAMALREDLGFLRGDGTNDTPNGLIDWALVGNVQTAVAATATAAELAIRTAVSRVEDSNVGMIAPGWAMRASAKNWLASLRDANNNLVFPSIDAKGELKGYPIFTTSQLPNNLGAGTNQTEVVFADFNEIMIGEGEAITIATSTEAAYVEAGTTKSAFQKDQTLMRAISEHDLAPAHDEAIAVINGVSWSI